MFPKIGVYPPKWMVYMENPIKMDDLGVPPFKETPIYGYISYRKTAITCSFESKEIHCNGGLLVAGDFEMQPIIQMLHVTGIFTYT